MDEAMTTYEKDWKAADDVGPYYYKTWCEFSSGALGWYKTPEVTGIAIDSHEDTHSGGVTQDRRLSQQQ